MIIVFDIFCKITIIFWIVQTFLEYRRKNCLLLAYLYFLLYLCMIFSFHIIRLDILLQNH